MSGTIDLFHLKTGETHKVFLQNGNAEAYVFEIDNKQVFKIILDNEVVGELRPRELEKMTKLLANLMKHFHDLIAFSKTVNADQYENSKEGEAPELPGVNEK